MEDETTEGLDLSTASLELIETLLQDTTEPEVFLEILSANRGRPETLKLLAESPYVSEEIKKEAAELFGKQVSLPAEPQKKVRFTEEERKLSLIQQIQKMTAGEKTALAMKGGRDIRTILARDSNKGVVLAVLKNPKMTVTEVELMAHSRNIAEDALRAISKNREWIRDYKVITALVNNAKTPAGIAASLVTNLKLKDLSILEKNKNVSEGVRLLAKRTLQTRKPN